LANIRRTFLEFSLFFGSIWITEDYMGTVYADITLRNAVDAGNALRGTIPEHEVRQTEVSAMVDTGAGTLVIPETVREQLGLAVIGLRNATLANNAKATCKVTEPVEIRWKNRDTTCRALVVPEGEILLGAIPLEDMDLIVNPVKQELAGAHGDEVVALLRSCA
jgi:clan AA aspartic protease